jgi:hypothetical protein
LSFRNGAATASRAFLSGLGFLIPITLAIVALVLDKIAEVVAHIAARTYDALMGESRKPGDRVFFGILALVGLAIAAWTLLDSLLLALVFLGLLAACVVTMAQGEATP